MIKFNVTFPKNFSALVASDAEQQIQNKLRVGGFHDVTVKVDDKGSAVFTGPEDRIKAFLGDSDLDFRDDNGLIKAQSIKSPTVKPVAIKTPKIG